MQVFHDDGVIRQQPVLIGVDEDTSAQTLARVLAWRGHVGRPVYERFIIQQSCRFRACLAGLALSVIIGAMNMSEDSPIYYRASALSVEAILSSPDASVWLKEALQAALSRDPVDAAHDAEVLAAVLADRCKALSSVVAKA